MTKLSKPASSPAQAQAQEIVVRRADGSVCFKLRTTPLGLWVKLVGEA